MGLKEFTVNDFVLALSSREPTPGGGSAAALVGACGVGLLLMVANYIDNAENIKEVFPPLEKAKIELLALIDKDADSFNTYMSAMRLPKTNDSEKQVRAQAMQKALIEAADVPFQTLKTCHACIQYMDILEKDCKKNMISDLGAAATCLRSAIDSAYLNIIINAGGIKDASISSALMNDSREMKTNSLFLLESTYQRVVDTLAKPAS